MVYALTYDLNKVGQNYETLYKSIKSMGNWCHALQNLWFIDTYKNQTEIRESLQKSIDKNDLIFVCRVTTSSYDGYLETDAVNWLRSHI